MGLSLLFNNTINGVSITYLNLQKSIWCERNHELNPFAPRNVWLFPLNHLPNVPINHLFLAQKEVALLFKERGYSRSSSCVCKCSQTKGISFAVDVMVIIKLKGERNDREIWNSNKAFDARWKLVIAPTLFANAFILTSQKGGKGKCEIWKVSHLITS